MRQLKNQLKSSELRKLVLGRHCCGVFLLRELLLLFVLLFDGLLLLFIVIFILFSFLDFLKILRRKFIFK